MRRTVLAFWTLVSAAVVAGQSLGVVIDFTGGTVFLEDGTTVTTNNFLLWPDCVDYYVEDGVKFDFVGGAGTVGDYYSIGSGGFVGNDVVHAHWFGVSSIVVARLDGAAFDLNYMDLTSNTTVGGGQCSGAERSYVTASNGHSMLLPSSDWGFAYDYFGGAGDGVQRLWLDSNFDGITSFTVTSQNAYCFGLDNFYIDEPPPPNPGVPEPSAIVVWSLLAALSAAAACYRRARPAVR